MSLKSLSLTAVTAAVLSAIGLFGCGGDGNGNPGGGGGETTLEGGFLLTDFEDGAKTKLGTNIFSEFGESSAWADPNRYVTRTPIPHAPKLGGLNGSTYCAGLEVANLEMSDGSVYKWAYLVIRLTENDDIGIGAAFSGVDSISFYAKTTTPGVEISFNVATTDNSVNLSHADGSENFYGTIFTPGTSWAKHTIFIKPVVEADNPGAFLIGAPTGSAGDLRQRMYWGYEFTFDPANVTKLLWGIQSNGYEENKSFFDRPADVFIDRVVLIGNFPLQ